MPSLPHQLERFGLIGQGRGAGAFLGDAANLSARHRENTATQPQQHNNGFT